MNLAGSKLQTTIAYWLFTNKIEVIASASPRKTNDYKDYISAS